MPLVDVEQFREVAGARGIAAFLRRAELLQMQIADAGHVEACGELALGEAGPARSRYRTCVDEKPNAGAGQLADHGRRGRLLVADGEELLHFTRSINSIAAAGARTFPSWITKAKTSRGTAFGCDFGSTCSRSLGTPPSAKIFSRCAQA